MGIMIVSREAFDTLRFDLAKAQTECRVLAEQNRALQTTQDWFRVRITQLEHERAQLFYNYTGVKIAAPEIVPTPTLHNHPLMSMPSFEDVGDSEAARLGVAHDDDGTLKIETRK